MLKGQRKQFCKRGHDTFICGRASGNNCKQCLIIISTEWNKKNKEKRLLIDKNFRNKRKSYIAGLKSKACMDCGNIFPPECMDFDHRANEKKLFDISKASCTLVLLTKEIEKCDLVCANCHRIRTKNRLQIN